MVVKEEAEVGGEEEEEYGTEEEEVADEKNASVWELMTKILC